MKPNKRGGMPRRPRREKFECPHCGADVDSGAKSCRECGSDASTGWQDEDEIAATRVDLPQGYSRDEDHPADGGTGGHLAERRPRWWLLVVLVLAIAIVVATAAVRFTGR